MAKNTNAVTTTQEVATDFLTSMRGQYIISQALWKAIEVMRTDEYPEVSNIKDMEFLRKHIYNMYFEQHEPL